MNLKTQIITKPKIAQVMHILNPAGAEMLAVDLTRDLSDRFDFVFICLDGIGSLGEKMLAEGHQVFDVQRRPGIDWSLKNKIRKIINECQVDLIHAHQYTPFFYAALSRNYTSNVPILFTEHGRHYPDVKRLKHLIFNKLMFRKIDCATGVGEFVKDALISKEGFNKDRLRVIYNGVDSDKFSISNKENFRKKIRDELSIRDDQKMILQVARFHPVKDHETAMRAFSIYCKEHQDAVYVMAGDGPEIETIKSLAKSLNIESSVRFLGVRMDVSHLLASSDLFILSSVSEGISVTLLEAMSARVPICATDVGGNPEVIIHNKSGLLSPRNDEIGLAENIRRLLSDSNLCDVVTANGYERLHQIFTEEKMHQAYQEMYYKMLGIN